MLIRVTFRVTLFAVLVIVGFRGSMLWAATYTVGPNAPTAAASVGGSSPWTNPHNIFAADGISADVSLGPGYFLFSQQLVASGFNFNIPAGAVITGIFVSIRRAASCGTAGADSLVKDVSVFAVKGGVTTGANHALPSVWQCDGITLHDWFYAYYGSSTDLWGTTWTPADINSSSFGVSLVIKDTDKTIEQEGDVDFISVSITYTI